MASLPQGLRTLGWAEMWSGTMGTLWSQGVWSGPLRAGGALRTLRKERKKGHGEAEHQISDCVLETTGNKMNDGNVYSEKEEELAGNITLETPRGILFLSGGDIELTITLIQRTKV